MLRSDNILEIMQQETDCIAFPRKCMDRKFSFTMGLLDGHLTSKYHPRLLQFVATFLGS